MLLKNKSVIKIKKGKVNLIKICGKKELESMKINVPGDPSSAAFYVLFIKKSIQNKNVCLNKIKTASHLPKNKVLKLNLCVAPGKQ